MKKEDKHSDPLASAEGDSAKNFFKKVLTGMVEDFQGSLGHEAEVIIPNSKLPIFRSILGHSSEIKPSVTLVAFMKLLFGKRRLSIKPVGNFEEKQESYSFSIAPPKFKDYVLEKIKNTEKYSTIELSPVICAGLCHQANVSNSDNINALDVLKILCDQEKLKGPFPYYSYTEYDSELDRRIIFIVVNPDDRKKILEFAKSPGDLNRTTNTSSDSMMPEQLQNANINSSSSFNSGYNPTFMGGGLRRRRCSSVKPSPPSTNTLSKSNSF